MKKKKKNLGIGTVFPEGHKKQKPKRENKQTNKKSLDFRETSELLGFQRCPKENYNASHRLRENLCQTYT